MNVKEKMCMNEIQDLIKELHRKRLENTEYKMVYETFKCEYKDGEYDIVYDVIKK